MKNGQPNPERDYCDLNGALILKDRIEAYWRERGETVECKLHNVGFHPAIRHSRIDVRSEMVNGLPRAKVYPAIEMKEAA